MTVNSNSTGNSRFGRHVLAIAAALVMAVSLATGALAEGLAAPGSNAGGFSGPGPELATVQQALSMRDDSKVSIKGSIVKNLGDEMYVFQDATGTIEVEIDNDNWHGQTVTPADIVIISGEVDKEWSHTYIDVSSVVKQSGAGPAAGVAP